MRYQRKKEEKARLKRLWDETKNFYGRGAWYDEETGRYIRYWITPQRKKYLKKVANKKVRKYKQELSNGSYRSVFDLWWELF